MGKKRDQSVGSELFYGWGFDQGWDFIPICSHKKAISILARGYLVKFKENKHFTLQDHYNLAVADQRNWLEDFGDPHPYIKMDAENSSEPQDFSVGNYPGKLYEFYGAFSDSGVGSKDLNLHNRILMALMAAVLNANNSRLNLTGRNFLPKNFSVNYEKVILRGYIGIIDLEKNTKVVLYGNSAAISENGQLKDYYPLLKQDILEAFHSVEIDKL